MPDVYEGDCPYIFVSYAHADRDAVLPIIRALAEEGYRVWYDDGIQAGSSFPDYIADRLFGCSCVLMLVSRSSLESGWCRNEVGYALDLVRPVLPVYLEDVELPRALRMRLGSVQALYWYAYATDQEFNEELFAVRMLDSCLTEEGKNNRGVRPKHRQVPGNASVDVLAVGELEVTEIAVRDTSPANVDANPEPSSKGLGVRSQVPEFLFRAFSIVLAGAVLVAAVLVAAVWSTQSTSDGKASMPLRSAAQVEREAKGDVGDIGAKQSTSEGDSQPDQLVPGVRVQPMIDDYSWNDLKSLAGVIAEADESEYLGIAKSYNLVGQDGKLQGATKSVVLTDGTLSRVRIVGFRHDALRDGGLAGITFEFDDVPSEHEMNTERTNTGGWEASEMRDRLNAGFINLLPDDLRSRVEEVEKLTNNVGALELEGDASVVSPTFDKIWLPSLCEIYGRPSEQFENIPKRPEVYDAEGNQYQLYADHGVMTARHGFCEKSGEDSFWWLRSASAEDPGGFLYISFNGAWHSASADANWGVSPCFCL